MFHIELQFSESRHGKGVMDGVGGSIKQNADMHVLHQKDIRCASDFVPVFSKSKTQVIEVFYKSIENSKEMVPPLETIEGRSKEHVQRKGNHAF